MKKRKKLAILSTHPIQYNAPLFALLSKSETIQPKVFYTWSQSQKEVEDKDFKQTIRWDIPLLEGYDYEFSTNTAKDPGLHHFTGLKNPELIEQIKKWEPDGILVYGWNFYSHLKIMRYFKGRIPVYFRGDSTLLDEQSGLKKMVRRQFLKWIYSHVDAAFFVGQHNKAYFKAHGLIEDRLYFAPHAIDNDRFGSNINKRINEASAIRKKLGIASDQIVVLFAGKFEPKKDPRILIEAFKAIRGKPMHLVMVGNGPDELYLKELALDDNRIHFLPFQNQTTMPAIYTLADLIVLPSQGPGETWGLAINEAMACSKAVLVSDKVGCSADLVKHGENGFVFDAGNINSLKNSLELLTIDQQSLIKMGKVSKEIIQQWSFKEIRKSLEENCFKG